MSILGIGGPEILLVGLLILLILGPERAPQAARALGRQWRRIITSDWWAGMSQFAYSIRNLPEALTKLAEIEDIQAQLAEDMRTVQQVQQEFQNVAKPVQEALSGKSIQQAVTGLEADIKGSLVQPPPPVPPTATPPVTAAVVEPASLPLEPPPPPVAPAASTPATAAAAEPVSVPASLPEESLPPVPPAAAAPMDAAPLNIQVDEETLRLGQEIAVYVDRLPDLFDRLEQLERQQAQLAEQIEAIRGSAASAGLGALGGERWTVVQGEQESATRTAGATANDRARPEPGDPGGGLGSGGAE